MKNPFRNFMEALRPSKYMYQPKFVDRHIQGGVQFKHSWNQLCHMHDLRMWTIAYAPGSWQAHKRMQELYLINQETWYQVWKAHWIRVFIAVPLFFIVFRLSNLVKSKVYNQDSHDANFREVTAHL